jgi:hypothetical protein
MKNLVRISECKGRTPFSIATLYKWRHEKRHPEIFVSLGKRNVFVDLSKLEKLLLEGEK